MGDSQNSSDNVEAELKELGATYSWTFTSATHSSSSPVEITSTNATSYPFIVNNSYDTDSLDINTFNKTAEAAGTYSLTVTVNNTPYKLNTPYTVTSDSATFSVAVSASANYGSNEITLTATPSVVLTGKSESEAGKQDTVQKPGSENTESTNAENKQDSTSAKSRKSRNTVAETEPGTSSQQYSYKWFVSYKKGGEFQHPVEIPQSAKAVKKESTGTGETLILNVGNYVINNNWEDNLQFYCVVTNPTTDEMEWNGTGADLTVNDPILSDFNVTGNTSIPYNTTLTLKASQPTTSFPVAGAKFAYQWQYKSNSGSNNGQWVNINSNNQGTTVSNSKTGSQLQMLNVGSEWNNIKVRCVSTYTDAKGNIITSLNSNESMIQLQTISLSSVNSTTLNNFAQAVQTAFQPGQLATTLQDWFAVRKTNRPNVPGSPSSTAETLWLNTILGTMTSSDNTPKYQLTKLQKAFDTRKIEVSAYPVQKSTILSSSLTAKESSSVNGRAEGDNTQAGTNDGQQSSKENGNSNKEETGEQGPSGYADQVMLKFVFTALEGYTWPSNLTTSLSAKEDLNYQATVNGQTLTLLIPTNLTPSFVVTPTTSTRINLNSATTLTATVKSSASINDFNWYVVTASGQTIQLTPTSTINGHRSVAEAASTDDQTSAIQTLFGEGVQISITPNYQNSEITSTLSITNITGSTALNNLKIYAVGIINRTGSYYESNPCVTPFAVTYTLQQEQFAAADTHTSK